MNSSICYRPKVIDHETRTQKLKRKFKRPQQHLKSHIFKTTVLFELKFFQFHILCYSKFSNLKNNSEVVTRRPLVVLSWNDPMEFGLCYYCHPSLFLWIVLQTS